MNERGISTSKDPKVFLKHILESIEWIEKDINNLTEDQFMENVPIQGWGSQIVGFLPKCDILFKVWLNQLSMLL